VDSKAGVAFVVEHHGVAGLKVNVVAINRFAGLSPRIRRRSLGDF
jgi:hypothetical protein